MKRSVTIFECNGTLPAGFPFCLKNRRTMIESDGERLFSDDIRSSTHCIDDELMMRIVRRGHNDRIRFERFEAIVEIRKAGGFDPERGCPHRPPQGVG